MKDTSILIIEDEEILLKILQDKFTEEGWQVDVALDGDEALKKVSKNKYDILLLDLLMPKVDGFEVIEKIRKSGVNSKVPIVVMSNLGDDDSIQKAINLGANEYFVKNQHPIRKILDRAKELAK